MFPPLPYIEWMHGRPEAATYDLGSSDLRGHPHGDEIVPPALEGLPDPPDDVDLEGQIAAEYDVDPGQVLVTTGATHANFLAACVAVGRADDPDPAVVVEDPGYGPLIHTPAGLGARIERFDRPRGDWFPLDPERIADVAADDTAMVTVSNRHNPSGRLVGRESLAEVAEIADSNDAHLLVDEVYAPYVTEPGDGPFGGPTAVGLDRAIVSGSLTKFHGLGDLAVGWLVGPAEFVARARRLSAHLSPVAGPSRALARRFFHNRDALLADSREHLRRNRDLLAGWVADRDDLGGRIPDGCSFGFVSHERGDGDAVAEAAWEAGVLVVPGRFFGRPAWIRISAGREPATVRAGLKRLGRVLDGLGQHER